MLLEGRKTVVINWQRSSPCSARGLYQHLTVPKKEVVMKRFWLLIASVTLSISGMQPVFTSAQEVDEISFDLFPNPPFVNCLARFPGDPTRPPAANARVERGKLNDKLVLHLRNIKPGLAFDLFTVQRSPLDANGTPLLGFTNFGLAWYQSDIEADNGGSATVQIRTILLDQIFGFDPDVGLAPTNTFHVGFWFNDPADAATCGFTGFTPFNGEHHAGPLAMISVPDPDTGLGPLCTNPDTSTFPAKCNP
jgi:hypothetical protein